MPRRPGRVGDGLRLQRPRLAVRRPREAGLERRLGRALGPGRRHDRGLRQGPRHGRRLARPRRRDQPPRLRARAAAQHPLRVPEHRRQEDEHVARAPGAAAHEIADLLPPELTALPVPPPQAATRRSTSIPTGDTIPRLFDEFDRICAAVRRASRRAASCRRIRSASSRSALADADADPAVEAARFRPAFRHLALLLQVPGVGHRSSAWPQRRARRSTRPSRTSSPSASRAAEVWLESFAPDRCQDRGPVRALPDGRRRL